MAYSHSVIFPNTTNQNVVNISALTVCEADTSHYSDVTHASRQETEQTLKRMSSNIENFTSFVSRMRSKIAHG